MGKRYYRLWFIFAWLSLPMLSGCGSSGNAPAPAYNGIGIWTWAFGSSSANTRGVYGLQGTIASGNLPGGRQNAVSWTDANGNRWLFGGLGYDSQGTFGYLNDLWKYDVTYGQWSWISGSNVINDNGKGPPQIPGARGGAISWYDGASFWLFGGFGYDSAGNLGQLNDLWKFVPPSTWSLVKGSSTVNAKGDYTTPGSTVPGARELAVSWIDASKNLWLFGGNGYDTATLGMLNDLWTFNTTSNQWTWISGSNAVDQKGNYGTQGTPSPSNIPGSRYGAASWTDGTGNLWFFGGNGYDASNTGILNDLWKYDPGTTQWTWVSGNNTVNHEGIYGSYGSASPGNVPGARRYAASWIDGAGNLWLFGGDGYDSVKSLGYLNDLWTYNPILNQWTWYNGSSLISAAGNYGTLGIPASSNVPGSRGSAVSWYDGTNKLLWLFGGWGRDSAGIMGMMNDLWHFQP